MVDAVKRPRTLALGGATYWRDAIFAHTAYRRLKRNAGEQRGYTIVIPDRRKEGQVTLLYMAGITSTLREQFWNNYKYKAAPKVVSSPYFSAGPPPAAAPKKKYRKRSKKFNQANAMRRGSLVHAQVAQYARLMTQDADNIQYNFGVWLKSQEQNMHPAARRAILTFNEATGRPGDARTKRFIPIWSELPVCDMWNISGETPVPWATKIDLIVYDVEAKTLVLVEIKTSNADFEASSGQMSPPLSWMNNSPLNQARVQLAVTTQLFRRTYGSILQNMWLRGCIVMVTADGTYSKRYDMDEEHEMADILQSLGTIGWFKRGKQPVIAK